MAGQEPRELVSCGKCNSANSVPSGLDLFECYNCGASVVISRESSSSCAAASTALKVLTGHVDQEGGSSSKGQRSKAEIKPTASSSRGLFARLRREADKILQKVRKSRIFGSAPAPKASEHKLPVGEKPTSEVLMKIGAQGEYPTSPDASPTCEDTALRTGQLLEVATAREGCAQVDDEPSWRRMLDGVNMGAVIIDKTVPHHYGHFSLVTSEPIFDLPMEGDFAAVDIHEITPEARGVTHSRVILTRAADGGLLRSGFIDTSDEEGEGCDLREPHRIELWRSPFEVDQILAKEVLDDIVSSSPTWNWQTVLNGLGYTQASTPEQISEAWHGKALCTSLVVRFWQTYLSRVDGGLDRVFMIFPLLADRALPAETIVSLRQIGFVEVCPRRRSRTGCCGAC